MVYNARTASNISKELHEWANYDWSSACLLNCGDMLLLTRTECWHTLTETKKYTLT